MANGGPGVVIVESGGLPVTQVTGGGNSAPFTVVSGNGFPVTLVAALGTAVALYNPDGTEYSAESAFPGAALILTWDSLQTDLTPEWIFDYDDVAVADVVTLQRASDSGFTADVTSYTDTIDSIGPPNTLDFATGDWAEQTWYVRAKQSRADFADSDWSNTEQILLSSDVTAPVLSSPTDAVDGTTAYTGSVSTDEGNGTLYWVVSTASNAPSATQIIAGQMHTGAAAAASGNQAVSGTGVQNISGSGLSTNTLYYIHYAHRDAANNNSNVASADGFSTDVTAPTLSSPVDLVSTDTVGTGSVSTNEANGTLYWVCTTSSTPPSAAQVKAGQDNSSAAATDSGSQAVSGTGVQAITGDFTGLTASTAYTAHYMHEDSSGNQSAVSSGDGFTTQSSVFDPLSLFTGGEVGYVLDFTDLSTLFQDTTASTPVTTNGQSIQRVNDLTTNNVDFKEGSNPPTYNTSLGYGACKFDGANDILKVTSGGGLAVFQNKGFGTMIASLHMLSFATDQVAVSTSTNTAGGAGTRANLSKTGTTNTARVSARRLDADSTVSVNRTGSVAATDIVSVGEFDWTNNLMYIAVDKGAATSGAISTSGSTTNAASAVLALGGTGAGAALYDGYINRVVVIDRQLTAGEKTNVIEWCAEGQGRSL